jgi:GNAT superfamily N-acetyltransferase
MPSPKTSSSALLESDDAERSLTERLRKLSTETDIIEGYKQPHSLRMAALAEAIGQRLGLHSIDLTALKFAALAHDLGERKMRRDYLQRPSALNWEEQLDLWRHPIIGEQEAQELKLPRQSQLLVRWHHEWWNGSGYPDGLAATAIPLGARILRVIDTYCALTSERPYRGAYDAVAAEQTLAEQAGIECDPRVVKALLAHLAEERLEQERKAAEAQSYETVPMEVVRIDELEAVVGERQSNVIEMPQRAIQPTDDTGTQDLAIGSTELPPTINLDNVPPFESPAESIADVTPAPPVPPPSPLWMRYGATENAPPQEVAATEFAPLDDSPNADELNHPVGEVAHFGFAPVSANVLPRAEELTQVAESAAEWTTAAGFAPTEEVPALTAAELAAALSPHPPVAEPAAEPQLTEEVPVVSHEKVFAPPEPNIAEPVASNAHLQIVPLSEVPDHFWQVAKWIYEEWWATPDNSITLISNPLKEHLGSTTVPQTLVAMIDGKPVGSVSLVDNDVPERWELSPWLGSLYVLPQHRGQGIGTRLLESAFTRAKLQGAEAVYLATPAHADFFAHLGWQILERDVGPRRLLLMMRVS